MLHCISVVAEKPDNTTTPTADEKVDNLINDYNPQLEDQQTTVTERGGTSPAGTDTPVHYYGRYRFDKTNDKATIVNAVSDALDNHSGVGWYTMYYHDCDHDSPDPNHRCELSVETTTGTTPDGVKLV